MIKNQRPIAVDLFAGAGGMTLGFEQAGFDVLASVEIDPIHCAIHKFNFPFWDIFCKDIVDVKGEEIRNSSLIGDREIDVVFGGPPCQGFSLIGKRCFEDPRNSLVFHFIRLVLELQPKVFVLENVKGMTVGQHKIFIAEIIDKFEKTGYKVRTEYQVLNAAKYGVPQNRERLFLIGCRQDLELPNYPEPITKIPKINKSTLNDNLPPTPTVWEAIQDLPEVEDYVELYEKDWVVADFGKPSNYARKLRNLCSRENNYLYERKYDPRILTSSLRTQHTLESIKRFESTPHGKTEPISRFLKLDPEGICNTLRAGTPSNRGAYTSPRPIHPFTPRCITVREAARLHSYPDWFRFHATKWHGFRQIGNSVPPLLAKAVALEIIKALGVDPSYSDIVKLLARKAEGRRQKAEGIYPFPRMPEPSGRPERARGLSPPPKSLIWWLAISVGQKPTLYCILLPSALCLLPSSRDVSLLTLDMSGAAKLFGVDPHVIEPRTRSNKSNKLLGVN